MCLKSAMISTINNKTFVPQIIIVTKQYVFSKRPEKLQYSKAKMYTNRQPQAGYQKNNIQQINKQETWYSFCYLTFDHWKMHWKQKACRHNNAPLLLFSTGSRHIPHTSACFSACWDKVEVEVEVLFSDPVRKMSAKGGKTVTVLIIWIFKLFHFTFSCCLWGMFLWFSDEM